MWFVFVELLGTVVFISGVNLTVRTGDGGHRGLGAEDGGKHRIAGRYSGRRGLCPAHFARPLAPYSDRPVAIIYPPSYKIPNPGVMGWGGQFDPSQFSKPSQQYGDSWLLAAIKRLKDIMTRLSSNHVPDQRGVSSSWDIRRLPTQQHGGPNQQGFMGTRPFWPSQQGNWQGGQLGRNPPRWWSGWVDPRQYNHNWPTISGGNINPFNPPPREGYWGVVPTYEPLPTPDLPDQRGSHPKSPRPFIPPPPGDGEFEPSDSRRDLASKPILFVK